MGLSQYNESTSTLAKTTNAMISFEKIDNDFLNPTGTTNSHFQVLTLCKTTGFQHDINPYNNSHYTLKEEDSVYETNSIALIEPVPSRAKAPRQEYQTMNQSTYSINSHSATRATNVHQHAPLANFYSDKLSNIQKLQDNARQRLIALNCISSNND